MGILALIPARGGSKRLPGKNVRILGGKPLLAWTIIAAQSSGVFDDILLSTDDSTIASVATEWGIKVPWLRPSSLSSDAASSMDVIAHALARCAADGKNYDAVMLLQPTSPFRRATTIKSATEVFRRNGFPLVGVSPAASHPEWCFHLDDNCAMTPFCGSEGLKKRSQDLPSAFAVNGCIYIASSAMILEARTFFTPETRAFVMSDRQEALDIDDEMDWQIAETISRTWNE